MFDCNNRSFQRSLRIRCSNKHDVCLINHMEGINLLDLLNYTTEIRDCLYIQKIGNITYVAENAMNFNRRIGYIPQLLLCTFTYPKNIYLVVHFEEL